VTRDYESERLHALDALRGIAMLLGVVLHAGMAFMHGNVLGAFPAMQAEIALWLATDTQRDPAYDLLVYVIHAFRMPTFFLLAGFFAHRLHARLGARAFLRHRARRVLVPFVGAMLTVIPVAYVIGYYGALVRVPPTGVHDLASYIAYCTVPTDGRLELVPLHLWFLEYLIAFSLATVAATAIGARIAGTGSERAARAVRGVLGAPLAPVLLALLAWPFVALMPEWTIEIGFTLRMPPHLLAFYGLFYAVGWCAWRHRDLLDRWSAWAGAYLAVGLLGVLPGLILVLGPAWQRATGAERDLLDALGHGAHALLVSLLTLGTIGLFLRLLARPSRSLRYLADASYWVYLVHLPLVGLIGIVVAPWTVPGPLKLLGVIVVSSALLLASYQACVRHTALGRLLNGRRDRSSATAAVPATA
jgi:peptidoglycan/LPS O-acetylase OafA/YrhL